MIKTILSILLSCAVYSQTVTSTSQLFVPLQRSFDIALSSNSFHTAKVNKSFGFDVGVSHQFVQFPKFDEFLAIDGKKVDVINLRSIRAAIDLPIYLQFGIHLTLPSFKIRDYDTNLLGYFAKFQIDQFISDYLPYTALQFNSSQIDIGTFFKSRTNSYQIQFSSKVLFFELYAAMMLNQNSTEFTFNGMSEPMKDRRQEFYYRAGLNLELFFFNIYAESNINQEMDYRNLTVGISLKI